MRPGQETGLGRQGLVFAAMMANWDLERPAVWAHDMGGAVALRAHLLHGADFSRLALMNVVAMRPWGSAFFDHVGRHVEAFQGVPPHIHAAIVRAYVGGALARPLPGEDAEMLAAPWLGEAGRLSFYAQFAQADEAFTAEIEPMFSACRCPAAVVWGEDDPWIPLAPASTPASPSPPRHGRTRRSQGRARAGGIETPSPRNFHARAPQRNSARPRALAPVPPVRNAGSSPPARTHRPR